MAAMDSFLPTLTVNCRLSTVNCSSNRRTSFRAIVLAALLCLAVPKPLDAATDQPPKKRSSPSLDVRVDQILRSSPTSRGFWGIEVAELTTGKILFIRDAQHLFHPASNMKLFTTAAALEKLGQDFVFRTTVESDFGPDAQGIVQNLYLVGRGDPTLCGDVPPPSNPGQTGNYTCIALDDMAAQVRAHGVIEVTGPLVADASYFDFAPYIHGWTAEDLEWGYGATVSALAFNSNALLLRIKPGLRLGDSAQASLDPMQGYYQLKNALITVAAGSESHVVVERPLDSTRLDVWGQIPLGSGEADEHVAIAHPAELVGELFRKALEVSGTVVKGGVRVRQVTRLEAASGAVATSPATRRVVIAEHDSPPLRQIVKLTNKDSRNFYAEMLLRTLGRQVKNGAGLEDGLAVLNEFAQQVGAQPGETLFADGSGLSRDDLVTPDTIIKLLIHMASGPSFNAFLDSLPLAGLDGTLSDRFKRTRLQGRMHAKTGTIEGVNALSGYIDLPSGKWLAFSIIGNNHPLEEKQAEATLDQIATTVYDWFSRRRK